MMLMVVDGVLLQWCSDVGWDDEVQTTINGKGAFFFWVPRAIFRSSVSVTTDSWNL